MPDSHRKSLNFNKKDRLASQHDFQSVFASARKFSHLSITALHIPNGLSYPRLGITLYKQYFKRAVDRNRLRRIVRESFRQHKTSLKGLDIVITMRSECTALDKQELRKRLDKIWEKLV